MRRLALLLALAGCAPSLQGLRAEAPQQTTFPGAYDTVAVCLLDALDIKTGWGKHITTRHVDRRAEQRATLTAWRSPVVFDGPLVFELVTVQTTPSLVRVELRAARTPLGMDHGITPDLWTMVDACAGHKVVTTPPRPE
jgi:hypothetical protein